MYRVLGLSLLSLLPGVALADFFFQHGGHTYQLVTTPTSWSSAKTNAENSTFNGFPGYLAIIETEAENAAIYSALQSQIASSAFAATSAEDGGGSAYVWLGANDLDTEGQWIWAPTGDPFWSGNQSGVSVSSRYNNWGVDGGSRNEPDNFENQDAAGMALQTWPNPALNAGFVLGTAGQWNDVDAANQLYYLIEYETDSGSGPSPSPEGYINSYRYPDNYDVVSAVPRGCLSELPNARDIPQGQVIAAGTVSQDFIPEGASQRSVNVRVTVWRHGCHDPNRSAILVHFSLPNGISDALAEQIRMRPMMALRDDQGEDIPLVAYHWNHGVEGALGAKTGVRGFDADAFDDGVTYVLDTPAYGSVSAEQLDQLIDRYNAGGQLRIGWGSQTVLVNVNAYTPSADKPQLTAPVFTGRMTGQWIADGLPATGLVLQVGEVPKQDRNYVFAIWFTYLDGKPIWVAANKDIDQGVNEVTLDMAYFEGGELFNRPGDFSGTDISAEILGTMTLRVVNCNQIEAVTNFSGSGLGTSTLNLQRLIRIAGYDCDGTQSIL